MRFAAVALIFIATTANAQTPSPCTPPPSPGPGFVLQGCGWLPPNHPRIVIDVPPVVPIVAAPAVPGAQLPTLTGCDHLNPYTNAKAIDCTVGVYRPGRVYWFTDVERAVVIGVSQDARGVEIVTVQFLDELGAHRGGSDHLLTFRNDGSFRPWVWLAENAPHIIVEPVQ